MQKPKVITLSLVLRPFIQRKNLLKNKNIRQTECTCTHANVNATNYIDDDDCVVPNYKNALYILRVFLTVAETFAG